MNYPKRSPLDSIFSAPTKAPNSTSVSLPNGSPMSPSKPKAALNSPARTPGGPQVPPKPDDKESPDYKKKQAMLNGPLLPMKFANAAQYGMEESLFSSLKDIFEAIVANQGRTGVVSPTKFLDILRRDNEMFRTSMHQDAHEFLNLLLNEVVTNVEDKSRSLEAAKIANGSVEKASLEHVAATSVPNTTGARTPSNTGWVHELFEGTLTSETKCLTCENVSQRDEAFLDLSVDLDRHTSVTSCLRKFSQEEMLCERNKFHCDRCGGLQEAEKRMKIKRLPKILALHLKRFKYTEDLQRLQKLFHRVVYPYHLRLFNTTDDTEDPDRLYELYAVVVHIGGGPYHGHYVSIVKTQDRGWLLFDDEMVEPVDKNYVRNFFGERPGLACAYVLFYQETTLEAVQKEQEAEGLAAAAAEASASTAPKDRDTAIGLGLKASGLPMPNGIHTVQSAMSPISDNEDSNAEHGWAALEKPATAPALSPSSTYPPTTPGMPSSHPSPFAAEALSPRKSDVQSKKERTAAEKERKAAEKEAEKTERARRKGTESRRKEAEKADRKTAADIRTAIGASKATFKTDGVVGDGAVAGAGSGAAADGNTNGHGSDGNGNGNGNGIGNGKGKENGVTHTVGDKVTGGLNRFRQTSKSMSKKPKFWTSSSREASKEETPAQPPPPPTPTPDALRVSTTNPAAAAAKGGGGQQLQNSSGTPKSPGMLKTSPFSPLRGGPAYDRDGDAQGDGIPTALPQVQNHQIPNQVQVQVQSPTPTPEKKTRFGIRKKTSNMLM